ncbi:MAG: hypothetical protein ACK468_20905 [Dolichospermum sp.]
MNADKLASFRVDSDLWQQFQGHAKENNTNASALLVAYIKSVVNTGNVITLNQIVNTSSESNNPSLSIHDIDNRIDEKINQSIQNIDNINTLSIQDIDNRIAESLADGGIGEAIAKNYTAMMGQFNGLLEKLQDLKSQLQELQSNHPAAAPSLPINKQLTTDNGELLIVNYQLPEQETWNREHETEEHEDVDLVDSENIPHTELSTDNEQLPRGNELTETKSDNSVTRPEKNQIDYVQKQLKKIGIKKSAGEIRQAFINAGFNGNNYEVLRRELIKSLSKK